jgi:hypothetical protein
MHLPDRRDHPSETFQREHALLLAVIQQALVDVFARKTFHPVEILTPKIKKTRRDVVERMKRDKEKALHWLLEEKDPKGLRAMSLDWICLAIGTTAERIRERVRVTLGMDRYDGTVALYSFDKKARA